MTVETILFSVFTFVVGWLIAGWQPRSSSVRGYQPKHRDGSRGEPPNGAGSGIKPRPPIVHVVHHNAHP